MAEEQSHVCVLTSEIAITSDRDEKATVGNFHHIDPTFHTNGESMKEQRETHILDDEDECISATTVSDSKGSGLKLHVLSRCDYPAQSEDARDGLHTDDTRTHTSSSSDQIHEWVKQQQLVSVGSYRYTMSDKLEQKVESGTKNDSLKAEAKPEADKDDEFASLALDIDQSIEQLNQLILDLDPEFEPVPTLARGHMTTVNSNGVSVRSNGVRLLVGQAKSSQSGKISSVAWTY